MPRYRSETEQEAERDRQAGELLARAQAHALQGGAGGRLANGAEQELEAGLEVLVELGLAEGGRGPLDQAGQVGGGLLQDAVGEDRVAREVVGCAARKAAFAGDLHALDLALEQGLGRGHLRVAWTYTSCFLTA